MSRRIWTVGYEGHDGESFVGLLRRHTIQRVIDIRELPLSRKPGFSKSSLALGLSHAGIAYTHLRALGTPRATRHAYKAGGSFEQFAREYLAHVEAQPGAVAQVESFAERERCALLCVERDLSTCHRSLLADVLAARGWQIEHV